MEEEDERQSERQSVRDLQNMSRGSHGGMRKSILKNSQDQMSIISGEKSPLKPLDASKRSEASKRSQSQKSKSSKKKEAPELT